MKTPLIIITSLVLAACNQLETPTDNINKSHNTVINETVIAKKKCQKMPPIIDNTKLMAMLVQEGKIDQSDTDAVKLQKLESYVLNKRKGWSTKCK